MEWRRPRYSTVREFIANPVYGGATPNGARRAKLACGRRVGIGGDAGRSEGRLSTRREHPRRLIEAAIEEFHTAGFHVAKISDIVARAGLTQPTFYIYFKAKEAIYDHLVRRVHDELLNVVEHNRLPAQLPCCPEGQVQVGYRGLSAVLLISRNSPISATLTVRSQAAYTTRLPPLSPRTSRSSKAPATSARTSIPSSPRIATTAPWSELSSLISPPADTQPRCWRTRWPTSTSTASCPLSYPPEPGRPRLPCEPAHPAAMAVAWCSTFSIPRRDECRGGYAGRSSRCSPRRLAGAGSRTRR